MVPPTTALIANGEVSELALRDDRVLLRGDFTRVGRYRGPVVGICNGFQVLCEAGLLPGALQKNAGLKRFGRPGDPLTTQSSAPQDRACSQGNCNSTKCLQPGVEQHQQVPCPGCRRSVRCRR